MKVLIFGDIYGKVGRFGLAKEIVSLKEKYNPDFIIANGENMTHGSGPNKNHLAFLKDLGVDIVTGGNHTLSRKMDILEELDGESPYALRPDNYYETDEFKLPGKGHAVYEKDGKKILVINLLSGVFLRVDVYNPFIRLEEILKQYNRDELDAIVVDFHRETTSEINAMALMQDGIASVVFGTHTHIQTNDDKILPKGTAMISDVGMVGAENSVIGADLEGLRQGFMTGGGLKKIEPREATEYVVNGLFVEIEDKKATKVEKIRINGKLN
ncbi:MAG: YmdB family metallophosphoesterase [Candidatus Gracilibacteria bacterium]|nr:YmdB family metallophosphoesterase [Candidatus Gracilibacteria bacterium]